MAITKAIFNKKAIILYGCAQLAEGVSVVNSSPTGTVYGIPGSATITGIGTQFLSEVAPRSYLYNGNNIIGQVKTVNSNTSITLYTALPAAATTRSPGVMGQVFAVPSPVAEPTKTLSVTSGSSAVTLSAADSNIAVGDYLYSSTNLVIGKVSAVAGTSVTLTANATATYTATNYKVSAASTGSSFSTNLGPANCIAALDSNFSLEYDTEAFTFYGSELDRSEITAIKDAIGKIDFQTLMPVLGAVTQQIVSGTGTITSSTGSEVVTVTNAANIAVNDFLYTTANVQIGRVLSIAGLNITLTGNAAVNLVNKGFKIGKAASTPVYDDLPLADWVQAANFGWLLEVGKATATNSLSSNTKLTVQVRLSSPDLAAAMAQKMYTLTDVRGNLDLDLNIATYGKLKFSFQGNTSQIPTQVFEVLPSYGTKKTDIAEIIGTSNITLAAIAPYASQIQVNFSGLNYSAGDTLTLGGLTFTASGATTGTQLASYFANIDLGTAAADLPVPATGTWSGTLTSFYTEAFTSTSVLFYSPGQAGNLATITPSGTGAAPTVTTLSNNAEPPVPTDSNICIKKISAPKVDGFTFTRSLRSCGYGWDKMAEPTDVTVTLIEDSAQALYVPEKNTGKHNVIHLKYGSESNNRRISIKIHDAVLSGISNGTEDNSRSQDLNFRNTGTTEIAFS